MKKLLFLFLLFPFFVNGQYKQRSTATSGTVTIDDASTHILFVHEATAVTLTINLPATPIDGQIISIVSTGGITTLTLSTPVGSVINGITSVAAGIPSRYYYDKPNNKWYRC